MGKDLKNASEEFFNAVARAKLIVDSLAVDRETFRRTRDALRLSSDNFLTEVNNVE